MVRKVSAVLSATIPALVVAALASRADAQGDNTFLRGTGKTDLSLTYSLDTYREFWVGQHKVEDPVVGRITRQSLNLWGAYGIDARTDVVVSASYVEASSDGISAPGPGGNDTEKALQDATIGLKYKLNEWQLGPGGLSLAFAPAVKIPMTHYENNALTAIGDGQIDYRFRGILQYTLNNGMWLAVETGYDYRTDSTPNELPFNVTAGVTLFDRVTIMPFYMLVHSYGSSDIGQVPFPAVEEEWTRWGVSAYVRVDERWGVTLGYKATITGENTGDVTGYWLGVVFKI
jgi:Putative MetA-pathway of phenol degradation